MPSAGPGTPVASIKGNILVARIKYIRERSGEAGLKKILARLSMDQQSVLNGLLLPVAWYPMALGLALDDAIADEYSPHDRDDVFVDMGKTSADVNLAGAEKVFIRAGDPQYLLRMAPQIYGFYYQVGHRTYEPTGAQAGILRTFDAESVTFSDCLTVVGWHLRALELCGARGLTWQHPICRANGGTHCEYLFAWSSVESPIPPSNKPQG